MLQAQLRNPFGQQFALLSETYGPSGDLAGWLDTISDWGGAIASGITGGAGAIIAASSSVGAGVIQAGKLIPDAAKSIAQTACSIVGNSTVQQGAALASKVPNPYAQGAAMATNVGAGICNTAFPPSTPQQPKQTAATMIALKPAMGTMATTATAPAAAATATLPAGSIQWQKNGLWHYAVPKAAAKAMGLGQPKIGLLGTFVSPWENPNRFVSPYLPPGQLKDLWRRQYNWTSVNTADSPYLATWGLGETHTEVGTGAQPLPNVQQVDAGTGEKATKSIFKKWWFWALIGGGTLAAAGTGIYFVRRKK